MSKIAKQRGKVRELREFLSMRKKCGGAFATREYLTELSTQSGAKAVLIHGRSRKSHVERLKLFYSK